jgi:orotate phosphoribosyltransferase
MLPYQEEFIDFAIRSDVLRFGDFTLKSGRRSPYFFNTGLFNNGSRLFQLGSFYARSLQHWNIQYDILFGPAYKGIPLVCATAIALHTELGREVPFVFNRKEAKDHGEGGLLVGAPLTGRTLIVDDVITAGTSVRESVEIISSNNNNAQPCGVLIAFDRQEKGKDGISAVKEVEQNLRIPVHAIVCFEHLIEFMSMNARSEELDRLLKYREAFGASGE